MLYLVAGSHRDTLYCYLYINFVYFKIRCAYLIDDELQVKYFNFLSRISSA